MGSGGWAARMAADWPAAEVRIDGGWRLGYTEGVTKRANSATALGSDVSYAALEGFYGARGAVPCVQVWQGDAAEVDEGLAGRGYRRVDPTRLLVREIERRPLLPAGIAVHAEPDAVWRSLWAEEGADARTVDVTHRIMGRVPVMGFAVQETGAARGCVAVNGEWAGIYGMATRAADRGRGHAGRIVAALLSWAHDKGARRAYLLVTEANTAAVRAYARAGFVPESGYHYRVGR